MNEFYYDIYDRGLETVAVWTTFSPALQVGEVTLGQHSADVNLLNAHTQERNTAQETLDSARNGRDTSCAGVLDICTRGCRVISGSLAAGDPMRKDVRDVTGLKGRSQQGTLEKARRLISLWQAVDARRAAQFPALPGLLVGTTEVGSFQSMQANHAQILQNVENKRSVLSQKKSQLRGTVKRVDGNNKRWFQAWLGQFAAGTPERQALSLISTETRPLLPGKGVFLEFAVLTEQQVRLTFGAARAAEFKLLHRGPGETAFSVLAEDLTAKTYIHVDAAVGAHTYQVVPANAHGEGAASLPLEVDVAEAIAA